MKPTNNSSLTLPDPMTREKATTLAARLLGSYPSLNVHDPKIYMTELTLMLLKYPPSIGEQAIIEARRKSPQFIPSVPQVEEACEALFKDTRSAITWAQAWDKRSIEQLAERAQIEQAEREESPEYRRQVVDRIIRELAEAKKL